MNSIPRNDSFSAEGKAGGPLSGPVLSSAEATLQVIARLPSPEGLEDRVIAGLHSAPRSSSVLHWPGSAGTSTAWMRGAVAAAIVFVVAGGGWGVYTRVQSSQPAKVLVMPRGGATGGFSGAGAIRTPDTLRGPTVAQSAKANTHEAKVGKKSSARAIHLPLHAVQPSAQNVIVIQPKVSATK